MMPMNLQTVSSGPTKIHLLILIRTTVFPALTNEAVYGDHLPLDLLRAIENCATNPLKAVDFRVRELTLTARHAACRLYRDRRDGAVQGQHHPMGRDTGGEWQGEFETFPAPRKARTRKQN